MFFYFHPYLGKIPILTNIVQRGWNHQLEKIAQKQPEPQPAPKSWRELNQQLKHGGFYRKAAGRGGLALGGKFLIQMLYTRYTDMLCSKKFDSIFFIINPQIEDK